MANDFYATQNVFLRIVWLVAASNVWRGIVCAAPIIKEGTRKLIFNGHDTFFWRDVWLMSEPLLGFKLIDIELVDSYRKVSDYWERGVGWDWDALELLLPDNVSRKLEAFLLCEDEDMKDGVCWGLEPNGDFSITSAYTASIGDSNVLKDPFMEMYLEDRNSRSY